MRANHPGELPFLAAWEGLRRLLPAARRGAPLTAGEWDLLREGLAWLPPKRFGEIGRDMAALAGQRSRPVVCPPRDQASGACPVSAQRPAICRSYGFYVRRELGLHGRDIEARVAGSECEPPS